MKKQILLLTLVLLGVNLAAPALSMVPRPEYPRPQFERAGWVNLNGTWDYIFDLVGSGIERGYEKAISFEGKITVPFCPESKLSGVGYTDFIPHMWYHRVLDIPAGWQSKDIVLNFGAVYNNAEIYLDGKFVMRHFGGSSSFSVDLTPFVEAGK
ncbi:sugar-binding domain-containing protein, partial [Alistipes indistinctus]